MDGARPMTADIALAKAYSAAVMQRPTEMLENWRDSDPVFFTQVGRMGHRPIVATKGGVTIKRDGAILGGLGISGGSPGEDQQVCLDVLTAGLVRPAALRAAQASGDARAAAEVAPVVAVVDRPVFVQLPAPGYLAAVGSALDSPAEVDAARDRGLALAALLRAEIEALAAEGVAYVALANPLYPPPLTVAGREQLSAAGLDADAVLGALLDADRAAVADLTAPGNFRTGLDLTDSGPLPATGRGYDPTAVDTLLDATPFRRLCVDFPADPAARVPLERVKPGLVLSLGVVDVSDPAPENVDDILARVDPVIDERSEDDIAIATNGGFAQSASCPLMTEDAQNAKLRLVETVARYYWGNEI
jgi:5-methyltetrahydropteroyltriglutamate--homocysteine methyltransferase